MPNPSVKVDVPQVVKILRPSLDDFDGQTVLRGVIEQSSLEALRCDYYQRERLAASSRKEIARGLSAGKRLPDIQLGMRGDHFQIDDDNNVVLIDPVFIIDGRQRRDTILEYLSHFPESKVRLGAIIYFNTDAKWERERFHALNTFQTKVAPSVLLRNIKDDNNFLATLYGFTKNDRTSPLYGRVCWSHSIGRGELLTAMSLAMATLFVHRHLVTIHGRSVTAIPDSGNRLVAKIGLPMLRANLSTFWEFVDATWGLRHIQHQQSVPQVRATFLRMLGRVLSTHVTFWGGPNNLRLQIPYELKSKFKKFDLLDPEINRLCGTGGKAAEMLYFLLLDHLNSGKRTKRLVSRLAPINGEPQDDDDEEQLSA